MSYTYSDLVGIAEGAGFSGAQARVAAAIAMAESGGNPNAVGDNGTSYGLWQIHLPAHPGISIAQAENPQTAAAAAYGISNSGTNWNPWSTYTNGAYTKYLGEQPQTSAHPTTAVAPAHGWNGWGGFSKWLFGFAVLAVVLLAASGTQYEPVAAALAALIAVSLLFANGGVAFSNLRGVFGQ